MDPRPLKTCTKKHLFAPQLHTRCPYCGIAMGCVSPRDSVSGQEVGSGLQKPIERFDNLTAGYSTADPTLSFWQENHLPVVGWLVCTLGPQQGSDYRLHPGHNQVEINSSKGLTIRAPEPSGQRLAMISFDPRSSTFWIKEGTTRDLIYHNGSPLQTAHPLTSGDVLEVSIGTFLFFAFCGHQFSWDLDHQMNDENVDEGHPFHDLSYPRGDE